MMMMKIFSSFSLFLVVLLSSSTTVTVIEAQDVSEACKTAYDALYADNADLKSATDTYNANYEAMIQDYDPENQCEGDKYEDLQFTCNFPVVDGATEVQTACDAIADTTFVSGNTMLSCSVINDDYVRGRVVDMTFPNQLACVPTPPCTETDVQAYTAQFEVDAESKVDGLFLEQPIVDSVNCGADVKPNPEGELSTGGSGGGAGRVVSEFVFVSLVAGFTSYIMFM